METHFNKKTSPSLRVCLGLLQAFFDANATLAPLLVSVLTSSAMFTLCPPDALTICR
jgi:hypothetical protein